MAHLGDFDVSTVVYGKFTTYRPSTGATYTLGGTPALSVYKDNSTTQSTTGVTLTADFDTVTGLNHFAIDTSADGTFYSAGSFFDIVITTGTVDSVSVTGTVVGSFTLRKNSSLKPTTAARTLDVSAGGEAGVDWANVGSPTTTVDLSGTTISTAQDVDVNTIKGQTVTCAAGVTVLASVGTAATSTAQTGDCFARLGAPAGASVSADVAAVKVDTAAILADTGTDGVVVAASSKTGYALSATGSAALTEGYRSAGAAGTLGEILYEILAHLGESSISGTTKTLKKLDGSTTAKTYTLDSATTPTSITETT